MQMAPLWYRPLITLPVSKLFELRGSSRIVEMVCGVTDIDQAGYMICVTFHPIKMVLR